MSSALNVGVVGTGIFAKDNHLPVLASLPDRFRVFAAHNRTRSKAEEFAQEAAISEDKIYDTLDELLADKDVAVIDALVPVQSNVDIVRKAVAAGKPIIIEKPVAATLDQAREVVKIAESTDLPVAIAENWLFLESAAAVKDKLADIGDVVGFTYNSTGPFSKSNKYLQTEWRRHPQHIGGFLSDGGVHQLALLTDVLGQVESVSALARQVREASGAEDVVFSTLKMKSGAIGTFTYGSAFGGTDKWVFMKIYGTKGSILLDISQKENITMKVMRGDYAEEISSAETVDVQQEQTFGIRGEFINFHEAVAKKDKSLLKSTPRATFHQLACVAAFLDSSSQGGNHVKVQAP
ncbi:AaceriAGR403Wp [[Ashbya] aceris (nom. inval.)]|nr:AaceriAGR403Wp [[Ashbya] aceris (nom. inval.)]